MNMESMIIMLVHHDGNLSSDQGEECPFPRLNPIYSELRIVKKANRKISVQIQLS